MTGSSQFPSFACVCDHCDRSTASVFCMSDGVFLCQSCDAQIHNNRIAIRHMRVPYTQCPAWAYREAKSKGRLREGVSVQQSATGASSALAAAMQHNVQQAAACGMQPSGWGSAMQPQASQPQLPPHWFSSSLSGLGQAGMQGCQAGAMGPSGFGALQSLGDLCTPTSLTTDPGVASWLNPPLPHVNATGAHNFRPATAQHHPSSSDAMSMGPANTPCSQSEPFQGINAKNAVNQNLASLLEEFKLPDGSAEDSLLLELPPSPPSVAQGPLHGSSQQLDAQGSMQHMDAKQHTGSLKSCATDLGTALDFDHRTPLLFSSPGSQTVLHNNPQQQQQQRSFGAGDLLAPQNNNPADIQRTSSQLFAQYQAGLLSGSGLLAYATGEGSMQTDSKPPVPMAAAATQPADQHSFPVNRSNPMPINGSNGSLPVPSRRAASGISPSIVRGLMATEDDRFGPARSHAHPTSSASDLGNNSITTGNTAPHAAATPDSSLHGGFLAAAALAAANNGGVASFDDSAMAAFAPSSLPSSLGASLSSLIVGGTVHGGTANSSCLGLARILDTTVRGSQPLKGIASLLIETASAASIEARAQALINSSSRSQQSTVLDPSVVTRIERPDGTIRELDPERAMQLHRYRQKRMARMKAFTEGKNKIRYECRKQLADSRPRVRGRFAKVDSFDGLSTLINEQSQRMGLGEHSMRGANSYAELMRAQRIDEDALFQEIAANRVGSSVHGGKAGNLSLGKAAQLLRRAASAGLAPIPLLTKRSSNGAGSGRPSQNGSSQPAAAHPLSRSQSLQQPASTSISAPAAMGQGSQGTPAGSSGHPSAGSPCLASTCAPPPADDLPTLGSELDAAIAAACEQECLTVTDQELAALGFGPIASQQPQHAPQPQQSQRSNSSGSSESMSTSAAKLHKHNQMLMQLPMQHTPLSQSQVAQSTGSMSPMMTQTTPYLPSPQQHTEDHSMASPQHHHHHQQQQAQHYAAAHFHPFAPLSGQQQQEQDDAEAAAMCIDLYTGDFADQHVSSMLDELLQEAPAGFAI